ncbi:MAG: glycosyltransferase family 4 protein [Gallionellaceae bacterium]|nr:glycosyltransferase family 4 protein [Gallionellaceae bacterium]
MSKELPRVLHFFKTYYPDSFGGIEQVIFQLCEGTAKFGFKSEVLALSPRAQDIPIKVAGHLVHQASLDIQVASTGFSLSAFGKFAELAKQADIIHLHYPWPFMDIVHFATRHGKPVVVTYHSDIIRQKKLLQLYRPLKNCFLSSVDRIVATSPNYLATSTVLNRFRDKVVEITYGLDKSTYPIPAPELLDDWRSKFGGKFFLFVGMLRYYKGLHILLDAVAGTDYPVVIIGSGPVEDELKEHANRLGLKNIYFLGALPDEDKVALLQLCYAVVFPSHLRSEAFGISLLEGAMYGKPMISSEIGTGTSYINVNGETGLVVEAGNSAAFREAMRYLWENPDSAHQMGLRAEERYWKLFTADRMAESYANLYKELLK